MKHNSILAAGNKTVKTNRTKSTVIQENVTFTVDVQVVSNSKNLFGTRRYQLQQFVDRFISRAGILLKPQK